MKVYELFAALKGNNSVTFDKESLRMLGEEEQQRPLCRREFFGKYRRSAAWKSEVKEFRTDVIPSALYSSEKITLITIELDTVAPKSAIRKCERCAECVNA